ncbi:tRNA (adenosine(37)-N6)-threonylcarbamoyltransferase complex dimerization subunit type 1 TsaB [Myxococcota bacterium]|nr:tRNA (adenosine(37)-N6)-threonylcarbamoyltransferase complex dimerization subunit type 1 TsaB [Myxococcota bacterium]MBU1379183.1 tRNA (adenosine(37)-N6)-threonylcarbamoyltransferase complex dimerization subunit type 1 TsaB [Myxococcota bacterium]MBU1497503.1 tRNA (adenosine(37)-N6)-threonylcarbamoyltransferase complex dimerization subunit type 1 TsaB [Myxococcota bacterium]
MTYILCVDTSSTVSCVALGSIQQEDESRYDILSIKLISSTESKERSHGPGLLGLISTVCEVAGISLNEIDVFASGVGPGTFTGIRIGLTTIKTLAWTLKKPIITVSAFDIFRLTAPASHPNKVVLIDARRRDFYTDWEGDGKSGTGTLITPEEICSQVTACEDWFLTGNAPAEQAATIAPLLVEGRFSTQNEITPELLFKACINKLIASDFADTVTSQPLYIRPPDAEISVKMRKIE